MLRTRLWMGALLIALTVGVLVGDRFLAPWFPFLFAFQALLALAGCRELIALLGPERAPQPALCLVGVLGLVLANWGVHLAGLDAPTDVLAALAGILTGLLLAVFLYEMATFAGPGRSVERMATTWFVVGYLGWLPCFFAQLRWLYPAGAHEGNEVKGGVCLALAVFVPKMCDTGAYFTGRLLGRHRLTPVLSPKKTWEGALGGLLAAALTAAAIDRLGPAPVLRLNTLYEIGFGLTVGLAGMLGDLAESLLKRDCQRKDASSSMPGFGGVLDVVDAVIFAAPVAYLWLSLLSRTP